MMTRKTPLWMQLEEDRIYEAALRARLAAVEAERDALRTALTELLETTDAIIEDTKPSLYSNDRRRIEQARAALAPGEEQEHGRH